MNPNFGIHVICNFLLFCGVSFVETILKTSTAQLFHSCNTFVECIISSFYNHNICKASNFLKIATLYRSSP